MLLNSLGTMLGVKPPVPTAPAPTAAAAAAPAQTASAPVAAPAAKAAPAKSGAAPVDDSNITGPLYTVITRNEFYRDGFRNMVMLAVVEAVIIIALIITIGVQAAGTKSQDRYFATTADGRIMQLVSMDKPNMSTAALMSWVAQASSEVMTFGYHDYQRRLQQSAKYFTRSGWESFTNAMQKSRVLEAVEAQQQVVSAAPASAPVMVEQGVLNGRYRWIIKMPLNVTYRGDKLARVDKLELNLVIERVPSLENPYGVGIEQWVAAQK